MTYTHMINDISYNMAALASLTTYFNNRPSLAVLRCMVVSTEGRISSLCAAHKNTDIKSLPIILPPHEIMAQEGVDHNGRGIRMAAMEHTRLYSLRSLITIRILIINLRRSDRLRFIMGIHFPVRRRLFRE